MGGNTQVGPSTQGGKHLIMQSVSQKSSSGFATGNRRPLSNNYMMVRHQQHHAENDVDQASVPGEFDADDMIVMDGLTVDGNTVGDDGTIDQQYMMMAEPDEEIHSGDGNGVVQSQEEMIDEETTS